MAAHIGARNVAAGVVTATVGHEPHLLDLTFLHTPTDFPLSLPSMAAEPAIRRPDSCSKDRKRLGSLLPQVSVRVPDQVVKELVYRSFLDRAASVLESDFSVFDTHSTDIVR